MSLLFAPKCAPTTYKIGAHNSTYGGYNSNYSLARPFTVATCHSIYNDRLGAHFAGSYPLHWQQLHQQYKVPQLCKDAMLVSPIASSMWDQQITPKFTYVHILFCVVQRCQDTLKWVWAARFGILAFVKREFSSK